MRSPSSPTVVQVTANAFQPDNISSESVQFVNNTNESLVLCLAEDSQCNAHLSDWCHPSYQFPGWIADWFPSAFITCTPARYMPVNAHQQVVMNFSPSNQPYEIMVQGHQAMKLVLMNPLPSHSPSVRHYGGGDIDSGGGERGGGDD